jgi:membrane fusion protein (multidrug efflux system)
MNQKVFIVLLLFSLVFIISLIGCGNNSETKNNNGEDDEVAIPVEVANVITGNIGAYFMGTATLEAEEETDVVAKVGGIVNEIYIEEGDLVEKNQILAKLDDEKLAVQVKQAEANLEKLKNTFLRSEELFKKNLISAEEYQSTKFDYEQQLAATELTKLDLQYTTIRAPINGVISKRMIKVGNMVLTNQATFHITGLDPLLAVLYVPERHMRKLKVGHKATFSVDAVEDTDFSGRIERISPVIDPGTGTMKVTVETKNTERKLMPGMFARIHIIYDTHTNTLLVPKDAIIAEDQESSVFTISDSIALRKIVKTGYINTSHIEILAGLQTGEIVVTTGKGSLKDSSKVEIVTNGRHGLARNE